LLLTEATILPNALLYETSNLLHHLRFVPCRGKKRLDVRGANEALRKVGVVRKVLCAFVSALFAALPIITRLVANITFLVSKSIRLYWKSIRLYLKSIRLYGSFVSLVASIVRLYGNIVKP
jgi:hypothetical protein